MSKEDRGRILFLRIVCGALVGVGGVFSVIWILSAFVDEADGVGFYDVCETVFVSGLVMLISCVVVLCRAKKSRSLYVLLLAIPFIGAIHFVSSVYVAHHAHVWLVAIAYIALAISLPMTILWAEGKPG